MRYIDCFMPSLDEVTMQTVMKDLKGIHLSFIRRVGVTLGAFYAIPGPLKGRDINVPRAAASNTLVC